MKAVILAAGQGKRMKELTKDCPKPMLRAQGSPVLEYIVLSLKHMGIKKIMLITGYQAEVIEGYFGNGSKFGLDILYKRQLVQDGTGKAPELAKAFVGNDPFLLSYGDVLTVHDNYPAIFHYFTETNCDALVSFKDVPDASSGGAITLDSNNRITGLVEKPDSDKVISHSENAGIYIFKPIIFDYTARLKKSIRGEYELTDTILMMIRDKLDVRGFELKGYWGDIGVPDALRELHSLLKGKGEI